jgi:hypothetical protein
LASIGLNWGGTEREGATEEAREREQKRGSKRESVCARERERERVLCKRESKREE